MTTFLVALLRGLWRPLVVVPTSHLYLKTPRAGYKVLKYFYYKIKQNPNATIQPVTVVLKTILNSTLTLQLLHCNSTTSSTTKLYYFKWYVK